jgi:ubiquinone/menaquinone biosynthesis C-methylase UbiE
VSFTSRQWVKRGIRTAWWLWTRRLEAAAVHENRSDYKQTWERLAVSESDAKMYVASDVDERSFRQSAATTVATLDRLVGIRPTDEILEIGCGVGRVGAALAPRCARWIGADISGNMLRHARRRLAGATNVAFVELSGAGLREIPSATVDVVYCTVVFMHLLEWDRYAYIEEARRVLRPGGRLYADNVDIRSGLGWTIFSDAASYPPKERPSFIPMLSSGDELQTYAEPAGFHDVRVHRWDDAWVAVTGRRP